MYVSHVLVLMKRSKQKNYGGGLDGEAGEGLEGGKVATVLCRASERVKGCLTGQRAEAEGGGTSAQRGRSLHSRGHRYSSGVEGEKSNIAVVVV